MTIPFNSPDISAAEMALAAQAISNRHISGGGIFTHKAETLMAKQLNLKGSVMLTTSCTHALEVAAILLDLQPGDEVIVPSFTFVSTALAFTMHGATPVFADVRPDTLNLDERKLESLITERTRAIVPVHYAGVGCDMTAIMKIARKHRLVVIEDNAHGLYGKYENQYLGSFGHMSTQSFHETKNITCGEGGALIINDESFRTRAEIIRDKGTDRSRFYRGEVDKYTWVDHGSSYCLSDMLAAILYAQLLRAEEIQSKRQQIWQRYYDQLHELAKNNEIQLPTIPQNCLQAYHMFYMLMPTKAARSDFLNYLKSNGVLAVFHYSPLDQSEMAQRLNDNITPCPVSSDISERLIRLPFFHMSEQTQQQIIDVVKNYSGFRA